MSETPAETIRRAATLMRERAREVNHVFPWRAEGRDVTATQDYDGNDPDWDMGVVLARCTRQDEAEHIASWHPLVALAVAGWLDGAAENARDAFQQPNGEWEMPHYGAVSSALTIARVYLGEAAG